MYKSSNQFSMIYKKISKNSTKINNENFTKSLQSHGGCGIIIERDCNRYAMKREVAAERCRFFRGVCPISNRAKEYFLSWQTCNPIELQGLWCAVL